MSSWDVLWHHQQVAIGLIAVVLIALFVLYFWRGKAASQGSSETPEEALKRRFAKGEIDEKTYEHMLEELRK
jgi:uncharacterized membrane protein